MPKSMRQSAALYTTIVVVVYEAIAKALNINAHPFTEIISYSLYVSNSHCKRQSHKMVKLTQTIRQ